VDGRRRDALLEWVEAHRLNVKGHHGGQGRVHGCHGLSWAVRWTVLLIHLLTHRKGLFFLINF